MEDSTETNSSQTTLRSLKEQVESTTKPEPNLTAHLAVEMVKVSLANGEISRSQAQKFADSLINDCPIPVTIGNHKRSKISPIDTILEARQTITQKFKEQAKEAGINYQKNAETRRNKAKKILEALKEECAQQDQKYGPFANFLSTEQRVKEAGEEAENKLIAKKILESKEGQIQVIKNSVNEKFLTRFPKIDCSNVFWGTELKKWLNSKTPSIPQ